VLCKSVEALGFDNAIYLFWPDAGEDGHGTPLHMTNYDDAWMQYWHNEGHAEIDIPTRKALATGYRPLIMDIGKYIESPDEGEDPRALHALWEAKNHGGCGKFFSHRLVHGASGVGGFGLASSTMNSGDFEDVINHHTATLSAMIHIGHARLSDQLLRQETKGGDLVLSGRQKDMLVALSKGMRYKQIAHVYGLSENTVAYHVRELKQKLQCSTTREILASAYQLGLLRKN
jgi:DNA-binding CsgD family transcriptional regulator